MNLEEQMLGCLVHHPDLYHSEGLSVADLQSAQAIRLAAAWSELTADHPDATAGDLCMLFFNDRDMHEYAVRVTDHCLPPTSFVFAEHRRQTQALKLRRAAQNALVALESGDNNAALLAMRQAAGETEVSEASTAYRDVCGVLEWLTQKHDVVELGCERLRWLYGPLFPGDLVVVGAQTNVGKTWWGLETWLSTALNGTPAAFISCEDSRLRIGARIAAIKSGFDAQRITRLDVRPNDLHGLYSAANGMKEVGAFTEYVRPVNLSRVCGAVERAAMRGARIVFVDYLTAIKHDESSLDRRNAVTDVVTRLKDTAMARGVVLFLFAQLHRPPQGSGNSKPSKHSFRESGEIEEKAETCMLLWRDEERDDAIVHAQLVKAKGGGVGRSIDYERTGYGGLRPIDNGYSEGA